MAAMAQSGGGVDQAEVQAEPVVQAGSNMQLDVIVVTAQRRDVSVQDTSAAISAFSSDGLEAALVPALILAHI